MNLFICYFIFFIFVKFVRIRTNLFRIYFRDAFREGGAYSRGVEWVALRREPLLGPMYTALCVSYLYFDLI
jgi:hypothetical protein